MIIYFQEQLRFAIREHESSDPDDIDANREVIASIQSIMRAALNRHHLRLIVSGILCLIETILFNLYMAFNNDGRRDVSLTQWIFRSALALLQLSVYLAGENHEGM